MVITLTGCSTQTTNQHATPAMSPQVNQVGFLPQASKWAAIPANRTLQSDAFEVVNASTGVTAWQGKLGPEYDWAPAEQRFRMADFSALKTPGRYQVRVEGQPDSAPFEIDEKAHEALAQGVIKAYYFARAGMPLEEKYAGAFAREAGHPDTQVLVHASAADALRPAGSLISSPKGWYDAGDYNKYIVNSGITTGLLLAAYEHFPEIAGTWQSGIPEEGNGLPDVLNEASWNIDWMLSMQDPADGGIYHKLTNLRFDGIVMPQAATTPRYVVQKTTAAALDFAAVMALASRVYARHEAQRPGYSSQLLAAAQKAFQWAEQHPDVLYVQPVDVATGKYDDQNLRDEFAWAATELFLTTQDPLYRERLDLRNLSATPPSWKDVSGMAWLSLAQHVDQLSASDAALVRQTLKTNARRYTHQWKSSAYRITLPPVSFTWGGNSVILGEAILLVAAYRLEEARSTLDAAQSALDYVLGRNPLDMSMVTGFGTRTPMNPHHRPSQADGVKAPVPGFMVGGPNPNQQDKAECPPYPSAPPALAYVDHTCSYASNEVAINWNAPLAYLLAALTALTPSTH
ncbi:glycoside hydrolase family 9 protein [Comamonas composti]|uniref:glycoside hydrolase family 9 protein n=1 Tax=Comamonas composti TaxID=408558 RepID=UPI001B7F93E5|nr:glycoside hydrolase family 9 protein [Comamonas composti]